VKTWKKIGLATALFILVSAILIGLFGMIMNDREINGFVGVWSMSQLAMPWNEYVVLTREPLQVMVSHNERNWNELSWLYDIFFDDGYLDGGHFAMGYINSVPAHAGMRAYTGRRSIITFTTYPNRPFD